MNKKSSLTITLILIVSAVLIALSIIGAFLDTNTLESNYSEMMTNASLHSKECMNEIKNYRIEKGLEIYSYDTLETGMIGSKKRTEITTTEGELEAKRTSTNPNWTAVYISYFEKAGLKEGDQVALIFSGSFPALNIMAMVACDYFGLDYIVMSSIGASYYGANELSLPFFEMANHLYEKGLLNKKIDYVSLGGDMDSGFDFKGENTISDLTKRVNDSNIDFIYEEDYNKNIAKRVEIIDEKLPNLKMLISVGGSMVAIGIGSKAYLNVGYEKGNKLTNTIFENDDGLIEYYRSKGIDVVSMLQIKYLSNLYNIKFDPTEEPTIGKDSGVNIYYVNRYKLVYPIVGLSVFLLTCLLLLYYKKNVKRGSNLLY